MKNTKVKNQKILNNQSGQSLIEFILLIMVMLTLSFTMLKGMNGFLANRWVSIIKVIARPTTSAIELY